MKDAFSESRTNGILNNMLSLADSRMHRLKMPVFVGRAVRFSQPTWWLPMISSACSVPPTSQRRAPGVMSGSQQHRQNGLFLSANSVTNSSHRIETIFHTEITPTGPMGLSGCTYTAHYKRAAALLVEVADVVRR